jgi:ADP-heptose:LPS heptosyltransferase
MTLPLLRNREIDSVAVFRALQLGDMLCAVPALRALRAALPAARIVLVGLPWARQFARRYGEYIDDFMAFPGHPSLPEQPVRQDELADFYSDMQARRYALALQLHGSGEVSNGVVAGFGARVLAGFCPSGHAAPEPPGRPMFGLPYPRRGAEPLRLLRLMKWLGAPPQGYGLSFPLTAQDRDELLGSGLAAPSPYVCIHAGARTRDKCWPARRFAEVADRLADEYGLAVVLTGSASEHALAEEVAGHMRAPALNAAAPLSIGAMAALMSGSRLLVCNDTGVSHIAAGLGLPSVVVFSKADMRRWAPLNRRLHRCIQDPAGERADQVLALARALLSAPGAHLSARC